MIRPKLLIAIVILAYLGAAAYASLFIAALLAQLVGEFQISRVTAYGVILFAMTVLRFAIARGLYRFHEWARRAEMTWSLVMATVALIPTAVVAMSVHSLSIDSVSPVLLIMTMLLASSGFHVFKLVYLAKRQSFFLSPKTVRPSITVRLVTTTAFLVCVAIFTLIAVTFYESVGINVESEKIEKQTMTDMRKLSIALEARAKVTNDYPQVDRFHDLHRFLIPTYLHELPLADGWKTEFRYAMRIEPNGKQHYRIISAGKGKTWEENDLWKYRPGQTTSSQSNIVLEDGAFIRYPAFIDYPEVQFDCAHGRAASCR